MVCAVLCVWMFGGGNDALAQGPNASRVAPVAIAERVTSAPVVDGRLDDAAWRGNSNITTFTQRDPAEGDPVSESTEVWIAYDDEALYVAGRLRDRAPVTSRLGRRDMALTGSDWLRISFDSFHDRLTAFRFDVNPSGVRRDAALTGGSTNGDGDLAWDGVWDAAATVDRDGWYAELRIPFSQLRFSSTGNQVWGIQIERIIDRRQETAMFSFTPKSEQGGISAFATLNGLNDIRPGRRLEVLPYLLSEARFAETRNNPFVGNRDVMANAGLDARYRVTSNLTLSATARPDFGQVEVDPAIINLSAFETRFEEKRPFFVEGASSFRFGGTVGGPSQTAASVFYSRRLGRAPQLDIGSAERDVPSTATILGAAKLSGKAAGGWSVGVLNAVTGEATGRYLDGQGLEQRALVEPRTNYFVGRVNRELRRGQTVVGGIFTSVNRDLPTGAAAALRGAAYTGGLDFVHEWARRSWTVTGFLVGSHVRGTASAIAQTQRSSTRYYQRPDAIHARFDPNATSMSGLAGTVQLRKAAGLHWTSDSWVQFVSPGYEINDIGFLQRADRRAFGHGIIYNQRSPGRILRDWRLVNYINYAENFDRNVIDYFYRTQLVMTHLSYWQADLNVIYDPKRTDDRLTRGGPLAMRPATWTYRAVGRSDVRKPIIATGEASLLQDRAGTRVAAAQATLDLRTSPRWNLSVGPRFTHVLQDAQYVTAVADAAATATSGRRYIFAPLDQTEVSIVTRLNVTFTPDLSLEMYTQPLASQGRYGSPKEFLAPSAYEFAPYGGAVPDRSFTTRSLRGNAVLRWEYRPGSTFYLVWQQDRLNSEYMSDYSIGRAFGDVFNGRANNVIAVKWTYWINP
jgi:hypothetical protein